MLSKYGKDRSVTAMIDKMDWVIMPVLNVDGYEYTHRVCSPELLTAYEINRNQSNLNSRLSYVLDYNNYKARPQNDIDGPNRK